jgi:hypothetical protein
MVARTNLVIKDQAATPADRTFAPVGDDANGVHVFEEKTAVQAGNPQFTAAWKFANGKHRPSLRLRMPTVQTRTENGINTPVVVRTAFVSVDFTFDEVATDQEKKDAIALMRNALDPAKTQINELLLGISDIY